MQENRSFDSYFGTFPGADGIPAGRVRARPAHRHLRGAVPRLRRPQLGGPHGAGNATADIDGGAMDGFVAQAEQGFSCSTTDPNCSPCQQIAAARRRSAAST